MLAVLGYGLQGGVPWGTLRGAAGGRDGVPYCEKIRTVAYVKRVRAWIRPIRQAQGRQAHHRLRTSVFPVIGVFSCGFLVAGRYATIQYTAYGYRFGGIAIYDFRFSMLTTAGDAGGRPPEGGVSGF